MSMTCMVVFSLIGSKAEPVKQYLNN